MNLIKYTRLVIPALASLCLHFFSFAQPILYGKTDRTILESESYKEWFQPGYTNYQPEQSVINQIKKAVNGSISVEVWMGTWCGDSKREVPRFLKLMDVAGFRRDQLVIYGLGGADSLYKQSPGHEEAGKGIFRVPVFIIHQNGKEIGRINEYPVRSLEKDLLQILTGQPYTPNYKSFASIKEWLSTGELVQDNTSVRGLSGLLRNMVANEYELNSLGYLLLRQNNPKAALRIFQINQQLYPLSANVLSSLSEGFLKNGQYDLAISYGEYALENNTQPSLVKEILKVMYAAWQKQSN